MGKFEVSKRTNGEYQFNLKAGNGQVILTSQGYSSKTSCTNGIESVRTNSVNDDRYERKEAKNGKHYFNLKASNGQIVGSSQMYETASSMENGIASVKNNAPDAGVDDDTE